MYQSINQINTIDSLWMLLCFILVIFMTIPGLALFYGGLVHKKNVISVLMKSFVICGLVSILWLCYGYSLAFNQGNWFIGNLHSVLLNNMNFGANGSISINHNSPNIPESIFLLFQLSFAIMTVALVIGGCAERMKFASCLIFLVLWFSFVYVPIAHMVWDKSGLINKMGVLDFAGGLVVHITSGIAGLLAVIVVGKRNFGNNQGKKILSLRKLQLVGEKQMLQTKFKFKIIGKRNLENSKGKKILSLGKLQLVDKKQMLQTKFKQGMLDCHQEFLPYNVILTFIGAAMLWIGWFGFNGGSADAFNMVAWRAILNTQLAASSGLLGWMFIQWMVNKKISITGVAAGAIAGLVGITPAAGYVSGSSALLIGVITGLICFFSCEYVKYKVAYDDSMDIFGVHGIGGIIGSLLTGIFATYNIASPGSVLVQLYGTLIVISYTVAVTIIILLALKFTIGLRVSTHEEIHGLDFSFHGKQVS